MGERPDFLKGQPGTARSQPGDFVGLSRRPYRAAGYMTSRLAALTLSPMFQKGKYWYFAQDCPIDLNQCSRHANVA